MWTIKAEIFTHPQVPSTQVCMSVFYCWTQKIFQRILVTSWRHRLPKATSFPVVNYMVPNIISVFNREKILTDLEQHENE